ncbi:hypothetical protein CAOG_04484 [Capsaspora owczarzaki ATCC 30864]|uniref:Translin n=1 Tax=Capsaspora owczarzaki (strain ATCC 30864) TaxID=595528 RepID=A0A0D2X358_CAPO3|nr:hypothetical protein CAOG_04484 [Capsaspora owczarzaki ATCC 30864]KJE93734.1 hypothetical protein CAOG_004484 [Capsaspora owczarzaki ATCC 30864]|eukprot:XP_004348312.1 hypothetical protein CAOG_04484 [Capsaspora owczarzaki ATCC 30864]
MATETQLVDLFAAIQQQFDAETSIREAIREEVRSLELSNRKLQTLLSQVHQPTADDAQICRAAAPMFVEVAQALSKIAAKVPAGQFHRYCDHWKFSSQQSVFLASLVVYLESETLITFEQIREKLGVEMGEGDSFHLALEDYLFALCNLSSELARLAVNSVTAGRFDRPFRIANFVNDLNSGFRLLNLKNDGLRKRFDALKYDVKKIEEVVYDLSIRRLRPDSAPTGSSSGASSSGASTATPMS